MMASIVPPIQMKGDKDMLPIRKILCPTDFSEPAYKGVEAGAELAEKLSARLILAHVVTPPLLPVGAHPAAGVAGEGQRTPLLLDERQAQARAEMQELLDKRIPDHLESATHILFGRPADEIVRLAEEEDVDLIVIATHGQTGWGRIFFGSVAEKVVRLAECPVLTVKRPKIDSPDSGGGQT